MNNVSTYNLGVLPHTQNPENFFSLSSANALGNSGMRETSNNHGNIHGNLHGNFLGSSSSNLFQNANHTSGSDFNFGLNLSTQSSQNLFNVSTANQLAKNLNTTKISTLVDFLKEGEPKATHSIGNLVTDLAENLTHLSKLNTAIGLGKTLHETTKAIKESDKSLLEATICKTAKVVTETAFNTVGNGVIIGGVPLYLAETIAFPPLAATIPLVGAVLPQAYANMEKFSAFAGKKAEHDCHLLFSDPSF